MHLPFEDLVRSRDAAGRQLAKLAKTDRAAIYTTSGQNQVDFTDDIDKLQADLLLIRKSVPLRSCRNAAMSRHQLLHGGQDHNYDDSSVLALAVQDAMACLGLPAQAQSAAQMQAMSAAQQHSPRANRKPTLPWRS